MYELSERERKAIESLGWKICAVGEDKLGNRFVELENWSPSGQDLHETIWINDGETLADAAWLWATGFDVDYNVELFINSRGKNGVPETIRELVEDSLDIKSMFHKLAYTLRFYRDDIEDDTVKEYKIPVVWQMYGKMYVEAKNVKEAINIALNDPEYPLPDGEYMPESLEVDQDGEIEVINIDKAPRKDNKMKELCTKTVKVYQYGDYRIEIEHEKDGLNGVWVYHKDYGIKSLMCSIVATGDRLIEIVEANLDDYIRGYREEYEDDGLL